MSPLADALYRHENNASAFKLGISYVAGNFLYLMLMFAIVCFPHMQDVVF